MPRAGLGHEEHAPEEDLGGVSLARRLDLLPVQVETVTHVDGEVLGQRELCEEEVTGDSPDEPADVEDRTEVWCGQRQTPHGR